LVVLPLSLFHLENRVGLSRGVQVVGAAWRIVMRIVAGVGDLMQRTRDGCTSQVLGGRMIDRSGDAECGPHYPRGDGERRFLGWGSKPRSTVYQWFGLKSLKSTRMVSQFDLKTGREGFSGLASQSMEEGFSVWASKPVAMVW
jgi:hypothetical protein